MSRPSVFISYAREDATQADEIYYGLLNRGFSPWIDRHNLFGGETWEQAIPRAVRKADFFLFCASSRSVSKRGAVQQEIRLALDLWRGKLEEDIYFIPVRLESCDIPEPISRFQWIDFFDSEAWAKIGAALNEGVLRAGLQPAALPIECLERHIRHNLEHVDVTVRFPEFAPADSAGIAEINAALAVFAQTSASRFRQMFPDEMSTEEANSWSISGRPFFLDISFDVAFITSNFISVRFTEAIDTGGAHPNHYTKTFNFIREPWWQCEFSSLTNYDNFKDFLAYISVKCIDHVQQAQRQYTYAYPDPNDTKDFSNFADDWLQRGAGPDPDNFQRFLFKRDELQIVSILTKWAHTRKVATKSTSHYMRLHISSDQRYWRPCKKLLLVLTSSTFYLLTAQAAVCNFDVVRTERPETVELGRSDVGILFAPSFSPTETHGHVASIKAGSER